MGDHEIKHRLAELLVSLGCAVMAIELVNPRDAGNQQHVNEQQVGSDQGDQTADCVQPGRQIGDALKATVNQKHDGHSEHGCPGKGFDYVLGSLEFQVFLVTQTDAARWLRETDLSCHAFSLADLSGCCL